MKILKLILITGIFLLTSCGYHMLGSNLSSLPSRIKTISVPVFENNTSEPNLEKIVTDEVIKRFQSLGKPRLVESGDADAVLLGTVTSYNPNIALAYTPSRNIREYRMEIYCDVMIRETSTGNILWQRKGIYSKREYQVAGQVEASKANEQTEKRNTSFEFARDLVSLLEGF